MKTSSLVRMNLVAGIICIASTLQSQAHQLWISASKQTPEISTNLYRPTETTINLGWGHKMPVDEIFDAKRFQGYKLVRPNGMQQNLEGASGALQALSLKIEQPGVYWVMTEARPMIFTRVDHTTGKIEYLNIPKNQVTDGEAVSSSIGHNYAKALLIAPGKGEELSKINKPFGHHLEIIPLANPSLLKRGDTLPFEVRFNGTPVNGTEVGTNLLLQANHAASIYLDSSAVWRGELNNKGQGQLTISHPGVWCLSVGLVQSAPEGRRKEIDLLRYRATLTFEVPLSAEQMGQVARDR